MPRASRRLREFHFADLKRDEGMSGGPVYLVESDAVIGVVQGYTQDPRLADWCRRAMLSKG
jgi:hypothetical protein